MPRSSDVHVIRLRDPWDCEVVSCAADPAQTATQPAIRFQRRFGLPTGLKADDQIELVLERVTTRGRVWLNDEWLGELAADHQAARFSLHGRLKNRNQLRIEFTLPHATKEPAKKILSSYVDGVRLEITSG